MAPLNKVDRVLLRSPAIWLDVAPDHWETICRLAIRHGWTLPRPTSDCSRSEWTFVVGRDSAIELSIALERIRTHYRDRELCEQFFGQRGWKSKLASLASFFASGGVAIFVCHSVKGSS